MHLLEADDHGNFSLAEFVGDAIPKYAILSHTWGKDSEEVAFKDIIEHNGRSKPGYGKLEFCRDQAKQDGLCYFWIDTCCIDKSSSAEVSKAINSMFRWYHNAAKCYVFLSDVSVHEREASDRHSEVTWGSAFRGSRWFTRGWTLQELIAPRCVEFFSSEGESLGDKKSLERQLQEITGIPGHALDGEPLSHFSAKDRISWAAERTTTLEEDKAYCLLGIFDVSMAVIYGEGGHRAYRRLVDEINRYSKNNQLEQVPVGGLALSSSPIGQARSPTQGLWMVPFDRNPRFTGREAELARLEEKLFVSGHTAKTAITGLGGVGKTQLVLELLYRTEEKHKDCSIIWLPATSTESLNQAYTSLAKKLAIPGWEDQKNDVKELVKDFLSKEDAGRWLLVFDNADDADMWIAKSGSDQRPRGLVDYLPRGRQGSIIFTTRDRKIGVKLARQSIVQLTHMDEERTTQLLEKSLIHPGLINERQDTTALLEELAYLPLAIVQAAAYINENGIALADYLALLAEQEEEIISLLSEDFEDDGRYREVKNPVATTWLISFEQIRRRDSLAAEYLSFMSCIDSRNIPRSLLPSGSSRKIEMDAIGTLEAYSFITRRLDTALDLHRLVHLSTRNWLRKEGQLVASTETAFTRFEEVFPDCDHKNRSLWRTYLPHARYVLESSLVNRDKTELMLRYGKCLHSDGRWDEAEPVFSSVFEIKKSLVGTKHPQTLSIMLWLAATYSRKGRWDKAEELGIQLMETSKRELGLEHPVTLTSIHNLALSHRDHGRWDEAERLQMQVVEISKKELGLENPNMLIYLGQLASTYRMQGRWEKAKELGMQVMETSKRVLGPEHPDTLVSMHNLAVTHRDNGRWGEAERLQMQVVEISKRELGLEHPSMLVYLSQLASTYRMQGRWDKAEELGMQVMETSKRVLGLEHPDTLTSMHNLALSQRNNGRWDKAERLQTQVIEISKKELGLEHPDMLVYLNQLASTYRIQGQWDKVRELEVQVIETSKRVLGLEHPDTLVCMHNLALSHRDNGRWDEAESLQTQVVEISKKELGLEHPSMLIYLGQLALTYRIQGQWDKAEELGMQVMETSKRVLGLEHPDTLICMHNLSFARKALGRQAEALKLMDECVPLMKQTLGVNHPDFISASAVLSAWRLEAEG